VLGYSVLGYFLQHQGQSVNLAKDAVLIERNISTLNKILLEARHWEQNILSTKDTEADIKFAQLLKEIRDILSVLNHQELSTSTKSTLRHISKSINRYEDRFNELVQLKTRQSIQNTRMDTNYSSLTSSILNSNISSLLKPLFNFTHFFITYSAQRNATGYQAFRLVIESLEKKIKTTENVDFRILDYIENFSILLDKNYNMELDLQAINKEVDSIHEDLQDDFNKISSELETVIQKKLQEAVAIKTKLKTILLTAIFLGVPILLLILHHILKSIIVPLKSLSHVMQDIKGGKIETRFTGDTQKRDEIVELALSFNDMLDTLEQNNFRLIDYQKDLEEKINELSRRETEKQQLTAKIQRIERMEAIGTLAGGVAHDLNNILTGVVSYPDLLLLELPADSPYRKPILTIQESGKKAAAIVQDLLTLARRGISVTNVINLNTLISDYLLSPEYMKVKNFYSNIEINTCLAADLFNITGSPVHLNKTIMNLVLNGAESISGSGVINIVTNNLCLTKPIPGYVDIVEGDYVVLSIIDNGNGISQENLNKIFEPFYTQKEMGLSGTGLGLAVVWGTVQDHNGYIDVQSLEGSGTTFTIYLPATKESLPHSGQDISIDEYMGNGESVLVIDDTMNQREIASEILQKLGYKVNTVASGEDAIEYLKNNPTDLLVLDMIMPLGIDGMETYLRALQLNPKQKAIITSGFSETARVKEAQKAGAGIYIRKPYTIENIGVAIKKELNQKN